jgi:hypothetical protein
MAERFQAAKPLSHRGMGSKESGSRFGEDRIEEEQMGSSR